MENIPAAKIQQICCDATSLNKPEKVSFFYKSSFHRALAQGRVHVDFSLNVKGIPVAYFGIWRYRVSFWLGADVTDITQEQGFEFYKTGFHLALEQAEKFVHEKYQVTSVMVPPTEELLLEKYNAFGKKAE